MENKFFIVNGNKILVPPEYYDHLKKYNIYIKKDTKYVTIRINKKLLFLHRYIMVNLLEHQINNHNVIDHINNNPLDNRIENLRIVSISDNSRNKLKLPNTTSKYHGVSYSKKSKKWQASMRLNKKTLYATYDDEIHAAHQYNLWVDEHRLTTAKRNDVPMSENFVQYNVRENIKLFPPGITKTKKGYRVEPVINKKKYYFTAETLEEAKKIKTMIDKQKKLHKDTIHELKTRFNKKKKSDGNYIFMLKNNEIIIDKETYSLMYSHKWHLNSGYIAQCNSGKRLSRILMNCDDKNLIVDHVNGNTLDNRKCNLRVVTPEQNALNKTPKKNCTSKYIGVCWIKKSLKWSASIFVDGKRIHLGEFVREQDAALARDNATKKYYKEFGKLNFPERPGWDEYFMNIAEAVKLRSADYYKVGGVLVSLNNNRIISTGYNSFSSGINENVDWSDRSNIGDKVIHAEMNVLLYSQSKFEDTRLYVTTSPCKNCLKTLSAANVKKIIYKHEYKDIESVLQLAKELNIELIEYVNIR